MLCVPCRYPGAKPNPKSKLRQNRSEGRGNEARGRRQKRVRRHVVPNPRLYRPAPPRLLQPAPQAPRPPARPRTPWAPPEPPTLLETASCAALRLSEQRRGTRPSQLSQRSSRPERSKVRAARSPALLFRRPVRKERLKVQPARSTVWADLSPGRSDGSPVLTCGLLQPRSRTSSPSPRRLVVKLPDAPPARRYRPASQFLRQRSLDSESSTSTTPAAALAGARAPLPRAAMDAVNRHSTSPEDCSEGNETQSAPSEFLAEFLSAIMRRQYAEALKYCRLILQYEPHNTTARGFYPLLQHKVQLHRLAGRLGARQLQRGGERAHGAADRRAAAQARDDGAGRRRVEPRVALVVARLVRLAVVAGAGLVRGAGAVVAQRVAAQRLARRLGQRGLRARRQRQRARRAPRAPHTRRARRRPAHRQRAAAQERVGGVVAAAPARAVHVLHQVRRARAPRPLVSLSNITISSLEPALLLGRTETKWSHISYADLPVGPTVEHIFLN